MTAFSPAEARRFVLAQTRRSATALVPELALHLATEITPLWQATEAELAAEGLPPPYWAFAWVGGQALARHLLDHPDRARGRRVLDLAAGCGIAALAAARGGAASVAASELDPLARAALALNAEANGVLLEIIAEDLTAGPPGPWQLVLAGDLCYERAMAERVTRWLRRCAAAGAEVLLADPGRAYLPSEGLSELARYTVPTTRELEDRDSREVLIYRVLA